jgi:hypothetical protein
MGIKEVPVEYLIPAKKYLFFSHTHKGQTHNMPMLNDVLQKVGTLLPIFLIYVTYLSDLM